MRISPLMRIERDVPIGPLTTYRVGGAAAYFGRAESEADLDEAAALAVDQGLPVLVVGKGSNLLVSDRGFPGLVVTLGEGFEWVDIEGSTARAGGALALPVLARKTAAASLTGLEWAVGVPGSVGGAVRMNAGGHGSDISQVLTQCRVFDLAEGNAHELALVDLDYSYRHSAITPTKVVVWAQFALEAGDKRESERQIAEIVQWRRENQPGGRNAGSVFTNPPGDSAGRLIDEAGLKGFAVGSAHVSPKHANFFQAADDGSADDVYALIQEVRRLVQERTGVELVPELRLIGFEDVA